MKVILQNLTDNMFSQIDIGSLLIEILAGLVVLLIGLLVIGWFTRLLKRILNKSRMDETLKPFLVSLINIALKILLVVTVIQMISGAATTMITVLGAASLAIGLAFQGALSNFAGGILILALRPFKVGDYIEAAGHQGKVEAIHVFNTLLVTFDNKLISVPNGELSSTSITNFTAKPTRRVDLKFGVGYGSDVNLVKEILMDICLKHEKVLEDPAPFVRLIEHGDSSLNFAVRVWANTEHYWDVYFDIMEQAKSVFDANNIEIPFPQMDVHMDGVLTKTE